MRSASVALALAAMIGATVPAPSNDSTAAFSQTVPRGGRAMTPAERRELEAHVARLARQLNVNRSTLATVARILGTNLRETSFPELLDMVEAQGRRAAELQSQIASLESNIVALENIVIRQPAEQALARASEAFNAGRFEEAESELARLDLLRRSDSDAARRAWADAIRARARLAGLRLDITAAELLLVSAAREERRLSTEIQWQLMLDAALARYSEGELTGNSDALKRAVELFREEVLPLADRTERPRDWAATQDALGNALVLLGAREIESSLLDQAVRAFEEALEVLSPTSTPLLWAATQNNLGNALHRLGEREASIPRIRRAIGAYEQALGIWTRESHPLDWALTHNNLGTMHISIAKIERSPAAAQQGIDALEQALQVITRAEAPWEWARLQTNLGSALQLLSESDDSPLRLERALSAVEAALEVRTRELAPFYWAMSQNIRAIVLFDLGRIENSRARLEQAVAAYGGILQIWTIEHNPIDWAGVSLNMAYARMWLAAVDGDRELLNSARMQAQEARNVLLRANHSGGEFADFVLDFADGLAERMP